MDDNNRIPTLELPLQRDNFLRTLIRHLSGSLQDVIGLEEASGFVSVVGQKIGEEINQQYKQALNLDVLTREQVSSVLVDLKRRINGEFYIIEENDERIVLGNKRCPFEDKVLGRPAMCMMTSNVFGTITADNLGYARVTLDKTIANGDPECRVVVNLQPTDEEQPNSGIEYYRV